MAENKKMWNTLGLRVGSKITLHNLFTKPPKMLVILKTECELIFESTLNTEPMKFTETKYDQERPNFRISVKAFGD